MAKRPQEKLVLKRVPVAKAIDVENDKVTVEVDFNGEIPIKEGGKVHTVSYGTFSLLRSDGKAVTVQVTAYYK